MASNPDASLRVDAAGPLDGVYDDYNDYEPWLYDSEGNYLNIYAGISWIF